MHRDENKAILSSIIDTYSTVLFSSSWLVGALVLIATMVDPATGITGLLGSVWAVLVSRMLGFDTWNSRKGLFAFNSMLVCLGVGYFFPDPLAHLFLWLVVTLFASSLAMLAYAAINSLSDQYLQLPSMSLAFSFVAVILSFYALWFKNFQLFGNSHPILIAWEPNLPYFWLWFFKSLGGIFFQTGFLGGLLIAVAMFVATRFGLFLALGGYTVSYLFMGQMGMLGLYDISYLGLNGILAAIAIGGVFLTPSRSSVVLALLAALASVITTLAFQAFFYRYSIPPYAFPFNITVLVMVYAFRRRLRNRYPYIVDYGVMSPEESLRYYLTHISRFYQTGAPQFSLPFKGQWRITQGPHGEITHRQQWANAWDFEIYDEMESPCREGAEQPDDYYCYRKPVLASADGWVARVVDGIEDNPVGQINTRENWGNTIVLHHGGGIYSMYCHLRPGSVRHKLGDYIRRGEKLGAVGNSGRSAVPHLHFNVQIGPEPGSPTIEAFLVNYRSHGDKDTFVGFGSPMKDESIAPLTAVRNLQDRLHLKVEDKSRFRVSFGNRSFEESWNVSVDLLGELRVESNNGSSLDFSVYEGVFNTLGFSGSQRTALWVLSALLPRVPFEEERGLAWRDTPPFRVFMTRWREELLMLLYPLFKPLKLKSQSQSRMEDKTLIIETQVTMTLFGRSIRRWEGEVTIEMYVGVTHLELRSGGKKLVWAERIDEEISE